MYENVNTNGTTAAIFTASMALYGRALLIAVKIVLKKILGLPWRGLRR